MNKHLLLTAVAAALLSAASSVSAQFADPRAYENSPVGINQFELGYAYVRANASLDPSLVIPEAKFNLNQGFIDYTHYQGLLHRMTWVEAGVPVAGLSGAISGTSISGSVNGAGDSSYQFAALVMGGPALSPAQFETYQPATTLGVSLSMTAPTGLYRSGKILNLGSYRWSFKPEVALSHPFGPQQRWVVDTYANAYFYTNNSSYQGSETLHQAPLPGLEEHISYSFNDRLWASLDTRYSFHGTTFVDRLDQNNPQQNFILGTEMNISFNSRNSLVIELAKALVHQNGPALTGFSVRYDYTWGKGYR